MSTAASDSPSRATALARISTRVSRLEPWKPLRIPKAEHWKDVASPQEPCTRHTRIDSRLEPPPPKGPKTPTAEKSSFFALSPAVRSDVYRYVLTQDAPIQPKEAISTSSEATPLDHVPLILAFPLTEEEIAQHVSYYLRCNTFTFDLRTRQGLQSFQAWCTTLGRHAWNVRSLTLRHWTAYWGLRKNRWIPLEDATHFCYSANGEIVASRTATTPKAETCDCRTVLPMLVRFDRHFDFQRARTIMNVQQLVACLRSRKDRPERLTLVDAGKTFAAMLDGHSNLISKVSINALSNQRGPTTTELAVHMNRDLPNYCRARHEKEIKTMHPAAEEVKFGPCTSVNDLSASPPSSPSDKHDPVLETASPSTAQRSPSRSRAASTRRPADITVGLGTTHLPLPRTPAHSRHRQPSPASELPDYASEYYTAAWGSPYQLSPSVLTRSARTAVSEQADSDRYTNSSPGPSFSLEHLIPSRFNELRQPPGAFPSLLDVPATDITEEDNEHTPRSRTKRWVQVPYKPLQSSQWWSDDSVFGSQSRETSVSRASAGELATRGRHKTREENRTLDQQSFWNTLLEEKTTDMSGLGASRWANTPSEDEGPTKADAPMDSMVSSYFDEKPLPMPPVEEDELPVETPRAEEFRHTNTEQPAIEISEEKPCGEETKEDSPAEEKPVEENPGDFIKPLPEPTRLAPPRLRKRVSWRGKNCVISIPRLDYQALGLMKPMSNEEFQQRLQKFEDDGYDTRGFDMGEIIPGGEISMHAKPMWPDEADEEFQASERNVGNVKLPNHKLWADYMDALTEARLAALGVSLGDDEPAPLPAQDMSRQSSNQYPASPFSPPLPTGSAASIGRPGMIRGHSHTMSMAASPISPLNGPFGHMHRHSTFHGAFPGFSAPGQQPQDQQRQAPLPGLGTFSPITPAQIGSPAQLTALRNELGGLRGPGSPLANQLMPQSTQDYSAGMVEDQKRRQHGYSQSMQVGSMGPPMGSMSRNFSPLTGRISAGPQPALPELLEDEDEEELSDPQPYVPQAKRQQPDHDIAIPTPRGHRHNISEGLERDVREAEERRQPEDFLSFGGFGHTEEQVPQTNGFIKPSDEDRISEEEPTPPEEKDPLGGDFVVSTTARGHRKTGTRANIVAPVAPTPPSVSSFRFNPSAEFQPGAGMFSFGAEPTEPIASSPPTQPSMHTRQKSSGHFNPAAITFEPGNPSTVPSSGFNFSSNGPSFMPDAPAFLPTSTDPGSSGEGKIFGKIDIPEIIKPAKKSQAVPILEPSQQSRNSESGTEVEDNDGRPIRRDERQKRQRAVGGDDGDEVPQFAEPTPIPVVPSQPADKYPVSTQVDKSPKRPARDEPSIREIEEEASKAIHEITAETSDSTPVSQPTQAMPPPTYQKGHKKSNSSLSAMAAPFVFHGPKASQESTRSPVKANHAPETSISELEEGEILEDEPELSVPSRALNRVSEQPEERDTTPSLSEPHRPYNLPESLDTSDEPKDEPTFDEIDAIMQQMNDVDTVPGASPPKEESPARSPDLQPQKGVTYLPGWPRSDGLSPSPKRLQFPYQTPLHDPTKERSEIDEPAGMNGWPPQRINKNDEAPHSDWSGLLSPIDEDKLQSRSMFFDNHIDSIISRVIDRRLQPLEDSLRTIQTSVAKRPRSSEQQLTLKPRSSSIAAESDADDEDDVNDAARSRPVSRGRDLKLGQIKSIVLEAIREQGPSSAQSYHDIADLHSALADMKVSFARAASESLELDDIRLIVEDAVARQPRAAPPVATESAEDSDRQLKEMQGRLDATLANALEDANHRQQAEAREADVRRMLKLAEEELKLLRESSQDDDARLHALEQERQELRHRAESADERCQSMEDEHEAMQATLEEYRTSSNRWRQEIDENKAEREELESNVSELEQRLEAEQEAGKQERSGFENTIAALEQRLRTEQESSQQERAGFESAIAGLEHRLQAEQEAVKQGKGGLESTIVELERRMRSAQEAHRQDRDGLERIIGELEQRVRVEREASKREKAGLQNAIGELEQRIRSSHESDQGERAGLERSVVELEERLRVAHETSQREREEFESTIAGLEQQFEETQESGTGMRRRLEKLHSDMATAAGQLASEKAGWKAREEDYIARCEVLEAQNAVHVRERAALEEEAHSLRAVAGEATDARLTLDHMRASKSSLDEMVRKQQAELKEQQALTTRFQAELKDQQALTARFERDYHDARESARAEIHRTRMSLETDVEAANHHVNIVRAEYESELARARAELDSVRMDADTAKERHALVLEAESDSKREALRKVNHDNSVALDKARTNYDAAVEDLKAQHARSLRHATEDKDRSEYFLNERLSLADAKLQHFQDRVLHLEERLEVTKAAAQAAAMSAQGKTSPVPTSRSAIPEKISPQALRESILVLQEQLQDRETRIEQLQHKAKTEGPAKIKERDTEIAWLRELLGVRNEELTELINALSRPTFDRDTVRDTAIRIRANLQMEQQEKERFGQPGSLPGQALASFTSFATPKAASLFNKWRSSMESTTLKTGPPSARGSATGSRSNTPSRPSVSARAPPSFSSGLMTPPATNMRTSPAPEATTSLPAPTLSHAEPRQQEEPASSELSSKAQGKQPVAEDPATPPELFTANEYDQDAEDAHAQMPDFDETELEAEGDEDLDDVADNQPPAFRSLEDELDEPSTIVGDEEFGA
ncbi:hypothetical protein Q7P37_001487 [Cladosporium fusiforme]